MQSQLKIPDLFEKKYEKELKRMEIYDNVLVKRPIIIVLNIILNMREHIVFFRYQNLYLVVLYIM